jgi:hypothetical protein
LDAEKHLEERGDRIDSLIRTILVRVDVTGAPSRPGSRAPASLLIRLKRARWLPMPAERENAIGRAVAAFLFE